MSEATSAVPNPGSPEAGALGCLCPVMDNARGKGISTTAGVRVEELEGALRPFAEPHFMGDKSGDACGATERPEECDCEAPEPDEGVALVSNECPIHNLRPQEPHE